MSEWLSVAELAEQERELVRGSFNDLFHAALPGSAPDNDAWLVRKARVVARFQLSSLHVGQLCRDEGRTIEQMFLVPESEYAPHGGAFPITVTGGWASSDPFAVSGLPQLKDDALVVDTLRAERA